MSFTPEELRLVRGSADLQRFKAKESHERGMWAQAQGDMRTAAMFDRIADGMERAGIVEEPPEPTPEERLAALERRMASLERLPL